MKRAGGTFLLDLQRTSGGHAFKELCDVRVSHAHTSVGHGLSDQVLFMRTVDVDEPSQRVNAAASSYTVLCPLKPKYASQHPVGFWKAPAECPIEHFTGVATTSKNGSQRTVCADFQTDTMRASRGFE